MGSRSLLPYLLVAMLLTGCNQEQNAPQSASVREATVLLLNNQPQKALAVCDQLLTVEPNNFQAICLRGEICEVLGDVPAAKLAYEKASDLRPLDSAARYHLTRLQEPTVPALASPEEKIQPVPVDRFAATDEKAYRRKAPTPAPKQSTPRPSLTHLQLMKSIEISQELDRLSKDALMAPEMGDRAEWDETPEDQLPKQIVRFDLGMGLDINPLAFQQPPSTTGHRPPFVVEEKPNRRRLFIGQAIGDRGCGRRRGFMDFPVGALPREEQNASKKPPCDDLKDNDGNGFMDRDDPKCWQDGINQSSYDPELSEKRELLFPTRVEPLSLPSDALRTTIPQVTIPQVTIPQATVSPLELNTLQQ